MERKQRLKMVAQKGDILKYLNQDIETFVENNKRGKETLRRFYMWKEI